MSALGWTIGGWLFLNLVLFIALLNRRSVPSVREKLFWWVIGELPFEAPDHRKPDRIQTSRHSTLAPIRVTAHRPGRTSVKILAVLAVIGTLVAGSAIFVHTHPTSIAACAFSSCG